MGVLVVCAEEEVIELLRDLEKLADRLADLVAARLEPRLRTMLASGNSAAGQGDIPWQHSEERESMDRTSIPRDPVDGGSSFETEMEVLRDRLKEKKLMRKLLRGRRNGSSARKVAR